MDQNDFSCIKQVTKTVQLTLPLKYTSNENAGVTEILDGWKRQFVPKLQGVVVNYRDIRLTHRPFFIHVSRTAPRYGVTATFDLFCPSIGDIVKGKINRTSRAHIGCLIEGTINATIHLPYDSPPNLSKFIHINRDILFQINRFEFNRHTIRVNGEITPECIERMEELFPSIEDDVPESKFNGLTNSMLNFHKGDGTSDSDSSSDESSIKLESIAKNRSTDSGLDSSSMKYENPSTLSPKLNSKKYKRDGESSTVNSPKALKKKRRKSKSEQLDDMLLLNASEPLTMNMKKEKKSASSDDLASSMSNTLNFESEFAALNPYSSSHNPLSIKREVVSPTNSLVKVTKKEKKGRKQKRDSESSIVNSSKASKKKRKKSESEEDDMSLLNASEPFTLNRKISTLSADLASSMLNTVDFESKFAALNPCSSSYTLQPVKREVVSPTNSTISVTKKEKKGKKRKHKSSTSDLNDIPHRSKDSKKKKKSKSSKK